MNEIQIFNNPRFGEIRIIADGNDEPLFCLADLCASLGISNHRNVKARLDEDDVRLMDITDNLGRTQQVIFVTESGMYDVVLRSDAEKARPFRKWLTSEVLPSIRRTGTYISPNAAANIKLQDAEVKVYLIEAISRNLRLNDASRLGMYQSLADEHNLQIPAYVSSIGLTRSAKDLLKDISSPLSAIKFNLLLEAQGYVQRMTRPSTRGAIRKFWSITDKGRPYGENKVSPKNQNETQPHWYVDKFKELYDMVTENP